VPPERFTFPYADASFDVCVLHSVFTHMLPDDVRRYLAELRRVLKPGGAASASYYLLNADAERHLAARPDLPLRFPHAFGPYRAIDRETPEYSVAYEEPFVRSLYAEAGLTIEEPIHGGGWCGRRSDRHQDVVVARRRST
jgi:SAM-dependent methyltransferase